MAELHINVSFTNMEFSVRSETSFFLTYIFAALFFVIVIFYDTLSHKLFIVSFEIKQRVLIYTLLFPCFVHVVSCSTEGKLTSPPCHLQGESNRGRIVESSKMFDRCVSVM